MSVRKTRSWRRTELQSVPLEQLPGHAQGWMATVLSTAPAEPAVFESAARRCYELAGIPWPDRVIWTTSPLALVLAAPTAALVLELGRQERMDAQAAAESALGGVVKEDILAAVHGGLGAAVCSALSSPAGAKVVAAAGRTVSELAARELGWGGASFVDANVGWAVRARVDEEVGAAVREAVCRVAWAQPGAVGADSPLGQAVSAALEGAGYARREGGIRRAVAHVIDKGWRRYIGGESWIGQWSWTRPDWTSFLRDVCGLPLAGDLWDRARAYEATVRSAAWWYPHRDFVMACGRPTVLYREPAGTPDRPAALRLHRTDGPALAWPDGWGIHAVHGRRVPGWILDHPERVTVQAIELQANAEVRRLMIERYGWTRFIADCGAQVVDSVPMSHRIPGLRGARLLLKVLPGEPEPIVYLEMRNSTPEPDGTHRSYLERVDPKAYGGAAGRRCHAAMASRWRFRDDSGQLRLTFERWQDYCPTGES